MNSLYLNNNDDLYRYLVALAGELRERGKCGASSQVTLASQFAFGSASEFLDQAMVALSSVQAECKDVLTPAQLADVESISAQIKTAFQRIGGA